MLIDQYVRLALLVRVHRLGSYSATLAVTSRLDPKFRQLASSLLATKPLTRLLSTANVAGLVWLATSSSSVLYT